MPRYNKARHEYGTTKEKQLKPFLEQIVGEQFRDAEALYSIFDWETDSYLVELKARTAQYKPEQFGDWLLPCCKGDFKTSKQKRFFYFWDGANELYELNKDFDFTSCKKGVPYGTSQEHYFVPRTAWKKIDGVVRTE